MSQQTITSLNCVDRFLRTRIDLTYYDPTYIINNFQNNITHYSEIPGIDYYKHYNSTLDDDIIVQDVNILYLASENPINLTLNNNFTISTKEFYLYSPNETFSFQLSLGSSSSEEESEEQLCSTYIHLFYAILVDGQFLTSSSASTIS